MTRDLIIHIGSHKTGTTTVQRCFMQNKDRLLEEHGVAYLHAPRAEHMHPYMGLDHTLGMVPHGYRFFGLDEMAELLNASTAPVTFVSSENYSFIFDPAQITAFAKAVAPRFDRVSILAYVRRQDSHMVSHHQEGAKPRRKSEEMLWGSEPRALPSYRKGFDLYLDYAARLKKWEDAFGEGSIMARVFERRGLRDGDIVSDVLSVMDLPADTVEAIEDQNTASGFVRAKVGHVLNSVAKYDEFKAAIVNRLPNEGRLMPSRDEAEAFYAHYADSNKRLNELFQINDRPETFDLDFSMYPETPGDLWTEDTANEAIESVVGSMNHLLAGLTANDLRDAAHHLEKTHPQLSRKLMIAAHRMRPWGTWIKQWLKKRGITP